MQTIQLLRDKEPLVHCLTNNVVKNFTANGLLAIGASPIMADNPVEVADIAKKAGAILINTGTLMPSDIEAMENAGRTANDHRIPIVLDPVAVGASNLRQDVCHSLLEQIHFTVIKGNAGEMAALIHEEIDTKGVDSVDPSPRVKIRIAEKVARSFHTIAVITGAEDVMSNGEQTIINEHGSAMLTKVTGGGCLLGAMIAAGIAYAEDPFLATEETIRFYTKAAASAATSSHVVGPASFQSHFLDALSKTV